MLPFAALRRQGRRLALHADYVTRDERIGLIALVSIESSVRIKQSGVILVTTAAPGRFHCRLQV